MYKPRGVNHTAASLVFDLPFKPESLQALQAHLQVQAHSTAEASVYPPSNSPAHSGSLQAACIDALHASHLQRLAH